MINYRIIINYLELFPPLEVFPPEEESPPPELPPLEVFPPEEELPPLEVFPPPVPEVFPPLFPPLFPVNWSRPHWAPYSPTPKAAPALTNLVPSQINFLKPPLKNMNGKEIIEITLKKIKIL